MPKYQFKCASCENKEAFYVSVDVAEKACPKCAGAMLRQMPMTSVPTVKELVDSYTNIHLPQDNDKVLEARRSEYFWKVEVPRLVNEYPLEECLKQGWLVYNEKNELVLQTKPPHKR
jgi:putative FmdB family regulatory protein